MERLKTKISAIIVIVICVIGLFIVWNKLHQPIEEPLEVIHAPENGSIAIKVEGDDFASFNPISIRSGGLDKTAATSVIFTTRTGEVLTVPALSVTSDAVVVPAPVFAYDKTNGIFSPVLVSLKVVQAKKIGKKVIVTTSNKSVDLIIGLPAVSSNIFVEASADKIPKGAITQLFTSLAIERLKTEAEKVPADNPKLVEAVKKTQQGMEELLMAVDEIIKNPNAIVNLQMTNGTTAGLRIDDIVWLDAFYKNYLEMIEKQKTLAVREKLLGFISTAQAQSVNKCVDTLMKNDYRIKFLDSFAIKFCNAVEPEVSAIGKPKDDRNVKWENTLQVPIAVALASTEFGEWGLGKQIGIGTFLSIGTDFAYEKKLPDWLTMGSLGLGASGSYLALVHKNPLLAELQTAIGMWDIACGALPNMQCLDSRAILLESTKIAKDIKTHPENLLFIGKYVKDDMFAEMGRGIFDPFVEVALMPGYSKKIELNWEEMDPRLYEDAIKTSIKVLEDFAVMAGVKGGGRISSMPAGISCPGDCSEIYGNNVSAVELSAEPDNGYVFSGWSLACSGKGACRLPFGRDKAVIATFEKENEQGNVVDAPEEADNTITDGSIKMDGNRLCNPGEDPKKTNCIPIKKGTPFFGR